MRAIRIISVLMILIGIFLCGSLVIIFSDLLIGTWFYSLFLVAIVLQFLGIVFMNFMYSEDWFKSQSKLKAERYKYSNLRHQYEKDCKHLGEMMLRKYQKMDSEYEFRDPSQE